jgi:hypothetical protein
VHNKSSFQDRVAMLIAHASADLADNDLGFIHAAAIAAALGGERRLLTSHVPTDKPLGGHAQL